MRIGIVNDMRLAAEALRRVVALRPEWRTAWIARDGAEAVARCRADRPDLLLMDLVMPVLNGALATRRIMQETPCAILVVTATLGGNMPLLFEAMGHGALDAVKTPVLGPDGRLEGAEALLAKIAMIGRLIGAPARAAAVPDPPGPRPAARQAGATLVILGASTGGPTALDAILSRLPPGLEAAFVAVQHLDAEFAGDLAAWLSRRSTYPVEVARPGARPAAGTVVLAGTNDHLVLAPDGLLRYTAEPVESPFRPSVDAFCRSAALHWRTPGVAVLLTGMGRDGGEGLLALRRLGWHTICQDEATSVVFGMPKAAIEAGAAAEVLPLPEIAPALALACRRGTGP
jgi:chemotaxis response regulator CheB